ncbi:hypothetical protein GCM10009632_37540 [Mycolicibacterium alvei]|uniref:Uncharacterized protein n=1 Tax=Mycolicibacterium alvei TaxID=67081 RepID=A0A6N4UUV7_9MYCO|nr:hypothetical protein MALV_39710 [Mycolicibacterium alvei]
MHQVTAWAAKSCAVTAFDWSSNLSLSSVVTAPHGRAAPNYASEERVLIALCGGVAELLDIGATDDVGQQSHERLVVE